MSPSAFLDRGSEPGERELEKVLGRAMGPWTELRARLASEHAPLTEAWSYSGKSHGWLLRLRQKKRTVVYLVPCPGHFVASFALGEKACEAARRGTLPRSLLEIVERAPKYPEGRGVRLEVRTRKDLASVRDLVSIKMAT